MNLSTPNNNEPIQWQKSERLYFKLDKEKNNMVDYMELHKRTSAALSRTSDQIGRSGKDISPTKSGKSHQDDSKKTDHSKSPVSNEIHQDVENAYKNLENDWNRMYSKKENNPIRFPPELEHHLDSIASAYYKHHAQQRNILSILCSKLSQLTGFSTTTLTKKLQKKKPKDELTVVTEKFNSLFAEVSKEIKSFVEESQKELALKNTITNDIIGGGSTTGSPQTSSKKDTISSKYIWNNDIKSKIVELSELLVKMYELRSGKAQQSPPIPLAQEKRNLNEKLASLWPEGWMTKEKIASMIYSKKKKDKMKLEQKQQSQQSSPVNVKQQTPPQSNVQSQPQQTQPQITPPPQNIKHIQPQQLITPDNTKPLLQQQMTSPYKIEQQPHITFQSPSPSQNTPTQNVNQIHSQAPPQFSTIFPQHHHQYNQVSIPYPPYQMHFQPQQPPQSPNQQQQSEKMIKFYQFNQPKNT